MVSCWMGLAKRDANVDRHIGSVLEAVFKRLLDGRCKLRGAGGAYLPSLSLTWPHAAAKAIHNVWNG